MSYASEALLRNFPALPETTSDLSVEVGNRKSKAARLAKPKPSLPSSPFNQALASEAPVQEVVATREELVQEWEGRVTQISSSSFTASLVDVTAGQDMETEEAELSFEELSAGDRSQIRIGTIFRWLIGYRYRGGTKEKFVRVVVRRLPAWTLKDLRNARAKAEHLVNNIVWD